jgi:rhomboid protease GluP
LFIGGILLSQYTDKYFNYLTNGQGFYMQNYYSNSLRRDSWIAIKEFPEGDYVVFMTDEAEEVVSSECIQFLNSRGRNYNLHKIVVCEGNYLEKNEDNIPKVIVDIKGDKILYCDKDLESLAQIAIIVNDKHRSNVKSHNLTQIPVTIILIAINIIMFMISVFKSGNIFNIDVYTLVLLGGKFGPLIDAGQWWRLVTCTFLHGGLTHILFNMYSLYILGSQLEPILGKAKYLILYFISGIAASILSYIVLPNILSIGASGAIFGLLGALLAFAMMNRDNIKKGALSNLVMIIGINLFIGATTSGIDNYAHIGGLITGILIGIMFIYKHKKS